MLRILRGDRPADRLVHPTMVKWTHVQRERERDRVLREHTAEMRAFRRTFAPEPRLSRLAAGVERLLVVLDPRGR